MVIEPDRNYDIIGDVHGCAAMLVQLLEQMGYQRRSGVWQHPNRQALFLGDIVDRGPQIREALEIVRRMTEMGQAHCIMGNHEYYALAWHLPAPSESPRLFVREHTSRHAQLWQETAEQFAHYPQEWQDYLAWFIELPLYLDAGSFRMAHACWDAGLIAEVQRQFGSGQVNREFIQQSAIKDSFAYRVLNRLLLGITLPLPKGVMLTGQDGLQRQTFRVKFWQEDKSPQTFADLVFQPDPIPEQAAQMPLPKGLYQQLIKHDAKQPVLFVGHYWRKGEPSLIRPNLACLDYSAVNSGKLVAYRYDRESQLDASKFVWVGGS